MVFLGLELTFSIGRAAHLSKQGLDRNFKLNDGVPAISTH